MLSCALRSSVARLCVMKEGLSCDSSYSLETVKPWTKERQRKAKQGKVEKRKVLNSTLQRFSVVHAGHPCGDTEVWFGENKDAEFVNHGNKMWLLWFGRKWSGEREKTEKGRHRDGDRWKIDEVGQLSCCETHLLHKGGWFLLSDLLC